MGRASHDFRMSLQDTMKRKALALEDTHGYLRFRTSVRRMLFQLC